MMVNICTAFAAVVTLTCFIAYVARMIASPESETPMGEIINELNKR